MEIAAKAASLSTYEHRIGAVIIKHGKVMSTGFNTNSTHPLPQKYFQFGSVHAETSAVLKCKNKDNLIDSDIYIFRMSAKGAPALAKPCNTCVKVLTEYGVRRAYWTTNVFPFWDYAMIRDLHSEIDDAACWESNGKVKK